MTDFKMNLPEEQATGDLFDFEPSYTPAIGGVIGGILGGALVASATDSVSLGVASGLVGVVVAGGAGYAVRRIPLVNKSTLAGVYLGMAGLGTASTIGMMGHALNKD